MHVLLFSILMDRRNYKILKLSFELSFIFFQVLFAQQGFLELQNFIEVFIFNRSYFAFMDCFDRFFINVSNRHHTRLFYYICYLAC